MTTADSLFPKERGFYQEKTPYFEEVLDAHCKSAVEQFKKITRSYALFHTAFFSLGLLELLIFILFFSFFSKSSYLAFALAGFFLTAFSYFVLLFYFQAKKPEQIFQLRKNFIESCTTSLEANGNMNTSLLLAYSAFRLIEHLDKQEYTYYRLPQSFKNLSPLLEKFSSWSHWEDVYQMKEMLLFLAIDEHIEQVKKRPLDLETHASLGDAYIELSKLYTDPRKLHPELSTQWISSEYQAEEMQERFKQASERAIEEFKIVQHFAPNNPWVHAKLATIYHSLKKREEEIKEYEAIQLLSPNDREVLYRLGILYFEEGRTAQALEIYETFREAQDGKAEELISYYS